jgi:hypothetical protein
MKWDNVGSGQGVGLGPHERRLPSGSCLPGAVDTLPWFRRLPDRYRPAPFGEPRVSRGLPEEGAKCAARPARGVDKPSGNRHIRSPAGISVRASFNLQDASKAGFSGTLPIVRVGSGSPRSGSAARALVASTWPTSLAPLTKNEKMSDGFGHLTYRNVEANTLPQTVKLCPNTGMSTGQDKIEEKSSILLLTLWVGYLK